MFVITIDLWPHGRIHAQQNLTTIAVANDGTGTPQFGNYKVWNLGAYRGTDDELYREVLARYDDTDAKVLAFPRNNDQRHLCALTAQVIHNLGLDEIAVASSETKAAA